MGVVSPEIVRDQHLGDDDDVQQRKRVAALPCLKRRWREEGLAGMVLRGPNEKIRFEPNRATMLPPDALHKIQNCDLRINDGNVVMSNAVHFRFLLICFRKM